MKKLALSSLVALFAVSSANAATNFFVGGDTNVALDNDHATVLSVAPEFGWKMAPKWDLGAYASFGYEHKDVATIKGVTQDAASYKYGAGVFARYNVAQMGGLKLLLRGDVKAGFTTYDPEDDDFDSETSTSITAAIIPMVTYDLTESFTLYAKLNFLGVNAGYTFENKHLGVEDGWNFGAVADSKNVMNTGNFNIGFNYNF